ncbi:MAG: CHAT domain-containing protein [Bernardetiaceae bacterium]|nr:CHAT domain-containing protein [Bernardetiaceae bacterium]
MQKLTLIFVFLFLISFSTKAQSTWQELDSMAQEAATNKQFKTADTLFQQAIALLSVERDTNYAEVADNYAYILFLQNRFAEAEVLLLDIKDFKATYFGKEHIEYALFCTNLAFFYSKTNRYQDAILLHREARPIIEKVKGKYSPEYAESCNKLAIVYHKMRKLQEAESYYQQALSIYEKLTGKIHPRYLNIGVNLATLYQERNNSERELDFFKEILQIGEQLYGKSHVAYLSVLSRYVKIITHWGIIAEAEILLREALEMMNQMEEKNEDLYIELTSQLAHLYASQGMYKRAEELIQELINLTDNQKAQNPMDYASNINNIAILRIYQLKYEEALALYEESLAIYRATLGDEHPFINTLLNNIAGYYQTIQNYTVADSLFRIALRKNEELSKGISNESTANVMSNLGSCLIYQSKYDEAEDYLLRSSKMFQELGLRQSEHHMNCLRYLAQLYTLRKKYQDAEKYAKILLDVQVKKISNIVPLLSEKERLRFIQFSGAFFKTYYSFIANSYKDDYQIDTKYLYNKMLIYKGLVFSSLRKTKKSILNSGDSTLIENFKTWQFEKDQLVKLQSEESTNLKLKNEQLKQKMQEINDMERKLSRKSALFAKYTLQQELDWKKAKAQLKRKEVIVDILRIVPDISIDKNKFMLRTDTLYIVLFITPKTKKQPDILVLENGSNLETKHLNYYKRTIEFKIEDQNSYNQYWKPIQNKLEELRKNGFDKIYFSPDGVYHQISLNTLQNPETGEFLLESQNIQLIGTSRDLIELGTSETDLSQNFEDYRAYLLGYPTYNLEGEGTESEGEDRSFSSLQRIIGQNIGLLPGTKTEIEAIQGYFKQKNIKTQVLLEADANEENFKNIISPTILHVATHGFFVPQIKESEVQTMQDAVNRNLLENPFMRSGLLLAGCETPNPEGEDGVLTAEEAMNLSLENTELVVLSACETGLGDIQNGEGVFGLQRAFQQAGAKTVLMSLWKVSDEATQLLMTEFYKNLLSGKSKRAAFKAAQLSLKAKFPEPYFWGAFVMVGE